MKNVAFDKKDINKTWKFHLLTEYIIWWLNGNIFDASCTESVASFGWFNTRKTSASSNHTWSCNNHARCGPGFGTKELREDATSDNACSILDAARDWAWIESISWC